MSTAYSAYSATPVSLVGFSAASHIGSRNYQEDRWDVRVDALGPGSKVHVFAVFDGHGVRKGESVSVFLQQTMIDTVVQQLILLEAQSHSAQSSRSRNTMMRQALLNAFEHEAFMIMSHMSSIGALANGSTATVLVINEHTGTATVAHCGDSSAAVATSNSAHLITQDHRPSSEKEARMVLERGGLIQNIGGVMRVSNGKYGVSVTRGFGDLDLAPGVTYHPEITQYTIHTGPVVTFVVATDGLWDVMQAKDILQLKQSGELDDARPGSDAPSNIIIRDALAMGAQDNVTVLVVNVACNNNNYNSTSTRSIPSGSKRQHKGNNSTRKKHY